MIFLLTYVLIQLWLSIFDSFDLGLNYTVRCLCYFVLPPDCAGGFRLRRNYKVVILYF